MMLHCAKCFHFRLMMSEIRHAYIYRKGKNYLFEDFPIRNPQ